jgi:asparagine synthase (glutamine-hydrolysing)
LLDRNLLEFLFALPRDQLVRPGERRSLMRRSLRGIVPDELLNRKRKAYISRAHIRVAEEEYRRLLAGEGMVAAEMGILNRDAFLHLLDAARRGEEAPAIPLLRALALEQWLRDLTKYRDPAGAAEGETYFPAPAQFHPSPAGL